MVDEGNGERGRPPISADLKLAGGKDTYVPIHWREKIRKILKGQVLACRLPPFSQLLPPPATTTTTSHHHTNNNNQHHINIIIILLSKISSSNPYHDEEIGQYPQRQSSRRTIQWRYHHLTHRWVWWSLVGPKSSRRILRSCK